MCVGVCLRCPSEASGVQPLIQPFFFSSHGGTGSSGEKVAPPVLPEYNETVDSPPRPQEAKQHFSASLLTLKHDVSNPFCFPNNISHAGGFQILIVRPDKHMTVDVIWATPTEGPVISPVRAQPAAQRDPTHCGRALLQDGCSVAVNCVLGRFSKGGLAAAALAGDPLTPPTLTGVMEDWTVCTRELSSRAPSQRWPEFPKLFWKR